MMENAHYFETVNQYNAFNNHETLHPLVGIIDFSKAKERTGSRMTFGLYCIFLKQIHCGNLKYGCNNYDYEAGTLVFISPGQVIDVENKVDYYQPVGHGLVFHPDLILGTTLHHNLKNYSFFSYKTNEALHLSDKERKIVFDCFSKIANELSQPVDKHSKTLIASNIELFLNYCERFYDRQFITRENMNKGILVKFEELLDSYFLSDKPNTMGLPTVTYFADELALSANYFGDLIKKETGNSAQEYIQNKIIEIAKNRVYGSSKTISEIAYEMGFKYPQHFNRLFKKHVGHTPLGFRNLN